MKEFKELIYKSPFQSTAIRLKRLSLLTCSLSLLSLPFLYISTLDTTETKLNQSMKEKPKSNTGIWAMMAMVFVTGVGSTALLSWFLRPYVFSIHAQKSLQQLLEAYQLQPVGLKNEPLLIERMDFWTRLDKRIMTVGNLKPSHTLRPLCNYESQVNQRRDYFYLHQDIFHESKAGQWFLRQIK